MGKLTGYLVFANEMRDRVRESLQGGSERVSLAMVSKEIGRLWKELAEEAKQGYKAKAADKQSGNEKVRQAVITTTSVTLG